MLLLQTVGFDIVDYWDWGNWGEVERMFKGHTWARVKSVDRLGVDGGREVVNVKGRPFEFEIDSFIM